VSPGERHGRRYPLRGVVLALGLIILGLLALDFSLFAQRAARDSPPLAAPDADGVVALTGGSGLRIYAGVDLVSEGKGERLLISGVHRDVDMATIADLAGGPLETYGCCVDIGYAADSTIGNARETADWAAERRYNTLLIVTSDYHMPRSLVLLEREMPDTELIAWPVRTAIDPSRVWSDPKSFRGVLREWLKWRVTLLG
jgi:uncharacterized SAM-binding protein YcdF (DUF218 family)